METSKIISEFDLIGLLVAREKEGIEYLYDNYSFAIYGVVFRITKSEEMSQEITQDCFLKYWTKIEEYNSQKGKLFTWMINIARNLAIDKVRSKEYKVMSKSDDISMNVYIADTSYSDQNNPDHLGVKDILETLIPEQKKLIDLMYFQGYSQSEISDEFGIPLGTVKTRTRAAISKLRKLFER